MFLLFIQNINIINVTFSHNDAGPNEPKPHLISKFFGIFIAYGCNIVINNTISMYNGRGIVIEWCNKTQVVNTIVSNNI